MNCSTVIRVRVAAKKKCTWFARNVVSSSTSKALRSRCCNFLSNAADLNWIRSNLCCSAVVLVVRGGVMVNALFNKLLVVLASLYVSRHLEHHCHGEHCHVCHHIHRCLELISMCLEMVVAPFVVLIHFFFFRLVCFKSVASRPVTLVSQKVLLLN